MKWYERAAIGVLETRRIRASISEEFVVRVYCDRIAVQSMDSRAISWETLQKVKEEVIGDVVAIEIFPKAVDVVNLRNTRHLWFGKGVEEFVTRFSHPEFQKEASK